MDALVGIIGAGPAGISAGVQLKRYGLSTLIFEKDRIGGLVRNAYLVENSMLYPQGIKGEDLAKILEKYTAIYALNIIFEKVVRIRREEDFFMVSTPSGDYTFKHLVVATGTRPRRLPFPGLKYHVTEMQGKYDHVLIIGGGEIALDYGLTMSERSRKVTILYRREIKANAYLLEAVKNRRNIELVKDTVQDIVTEGIGKKVLAQSHIFNVDEVLVAIGREPNIEIVKGLEAPNLWLAGDVKNGIYRQTTIAIGDGIKVAMEIWRWEKYGDTERDR